MCDNIVDILFLIVWIGSKQENFTNHRLESDQARTGIATILFSGEVSIKIYGSKGDKLEDFITEIEIMRKFSHKNVITMHGAWKTNDIYVWIQLC